MSVEAAGTAPPQMTITSKQEVQPSQVPVQAQVESSPKAQTAADPAEAVQKLEQAVEKLNDLMKSGNRSLNFSVDNSTEQVVVRVMDTKTDEVIRQIPNEQALKFAEYIEGMVGLIFEDQA